MGESDLAERRSEHEEKAMQALAKAYEHEYQLHLRQVKLTNFDPALEDLDTSAILGKAFQNWSQDPVSMAFGVDPKSGARCFRSDVPDDLNKLVSHFEIRNRHDLAVAVLVERCKLFDLSMDSRYMREHAMSTHEIGLCSEIIGRRGEALAYCRSAMDLYRRAGDSAGAEAAAGDCERQADHLINHVRRSVDRCDRAVARWGGLPGGVRLAESMISRKDRLSSKSGTVNEEIRALLSHKYEARCVIYGSRSPQATETASELTRHLERMGHRDEALEFGVEALSDAPSPPSGQQILGSARKLASALRRGPTDQQALAVNKGRGGRVSAGARRSNVGGPASPL